MAEFDLQVYLTEWNRDKAHPVKFYLEVSPEGKPLSVMARFPDKPYGAMVGHAMWQAIMAQMEAVSGGVLIVSSNQWMAKKGIIEILIASESLGYTPKKVAEALVRLSNIIVAK